MTVAEWYEANVIRSAAGCLLPVDGRAILRGSALEPSIWLARPFPELDEYALCFVTRFGVRWVSGSTPFHQLAELVATAATWERAATRQVSEGELERVLARARQAVLRHIQWARRGPCEAAGCRKRASTEVLAPTGESLGRYCKQDAHRAVVRFMKGGV